MYFFSNNDSAQADSLGTIARESYSLFFDNILVVIILGFIPTLIGLTVASLLVGWDVAVGTGSQASTEVAFVPMLWSLAVQFALFGIAASWFVQLTYDLKVGRFRPVSSYFRPTFESALAIAILSVVWIALVTLGTIAFVLPGIWAYGALCLLIPAATIERAGLGSLRRSISLTKDYRWAIIWALSRTGVGTAFFILAAGYIPKLVMEMIGPGLILVVVSIFVASILYALACGLTAISIALIYARLREIKEGKSVGALASAFDLSTGSTSKVRSF